MTTKTKKFRSFIFQLGYAESTTNASLLLTHNVGFNTIQEALLHLGQVLVNSDRESYRPAPSKCCVAAREQAVGSEDEFCGKCGRPLDEDESAPGQIFADYFTAEAHQQYEIWESFETNGWSQETDVFDWKGRAEVHNMECMLDEAKDWVKGRPRHDGGSFKDDADWVQYHMTYPNNLKEDRLLK